MCNRYVSLHVMEICMNSRIFRIFTFVIIFFLFYQTNIFSAQKKPAEKNAKENSKQNNPKQTISVSENKKIKYPARSAEPVEEKEKKTKKLSEIKKMQDYLKDKQKRSGADFVFNIRTIAGHNVMNKISYLYFQVQPAIKYKQFMLALDLNLEVHASEYYESPYPAHEVGAVRKEEWSRLAAYPNKILFLSFGDEYETPIFIHLGRLHDYTLGNGFIIYRYTNSLYYPDMTKTGIQVKVDFNWIGAEAFCSDVVDLDLFGGRFILRPFGLTDYKNSIIGKAEVSYVFVAETDVYDQDRKDGDSYVIYDGSSKILAHSIDVKIPILRARSLSLGAYYSYARIFDKGSGHQFGVNGDFANGLLFYAVEFRIINKGYIAPIISQQWDAQKKLSYWGSGRNQTIMNHLTTGEQGYSIFIELKNSWFKRKMGFYLTFEMYIGGETKANPHLQLGFFMKRGVLSDRVALRLVLDKVQISSDNFLVFSNIFTYFTTEFSVVITPNVEMAVFYIKSFTEDFSGNGMSNELFMLETRITF